MFLLHLTDPHLVAPPRRLFGLDPFQGLDEALAHLVRHYPDADLLLLTGDLTDLGEPAAYAALRERLDRLPMPSVLLLGNHDARPAFRAAFSTAPVDDAGFVQRVVDHGDDLSLVALDTHVAAAGHGELCDARLAWLDATLAARADRAVFLAMHHPPLDCGIPGMDAIGLAAAERFWAVVERHGNVRHVFAGHIHRPFFGRKGAVSVSTVPGTSHQVHLQFTTADVVLGNHEPGLYAVARLGRDGFDLNHVAFADRSPRFVFDDASNQAATPDALAPVPPPYADLV